MTFPNTPEDVPRIGTPQRYTQDYAIGAYVQDDEEVRYFHDAGLLPAAVQGPTATACEILSVCAPYGSLLVAYAVVRFGLAPLVPGIQKSDPNVIYLRGEVKIAKQLDLGGENYWTTVTGWYLYALLKPLTFGTDALPLGVNVTDRTDPATALLDAAAFVDRAKPLQSAASATVLGNNLADAYAAVPTTAPGDDAVRIRKLVPKPPRA